MIGDSSSMCFARRHMRPGDSAYYFYALTVSKASGVFYSDDRRDGEEFSESGISKNTVQCMRNRLEKAGWFRRIDKGKRRKRNPLTGSFEGIRYRVLNHDQWAVIHPGKCRFPKQESELVSPDPNSGAGPAPIVGTGENPPAPISGVTCPNLDVHLPQNTSSPAPNSGAKTVKKEENGKKRTEEGKEAAAAPGHPAFAELGHQEPFGDPRFQSVWLEEWKKIPAGGNGAVDAMERTAKRCKREGIPVPPLFFEHKRAIEKIEVENRYHRTPL